MKQVSIEMPVVSQCSISQCAYNTDNCCHARAITVGDGAHPGCDTYLCLSDATAPHSNAKKRMAGVGACKVTACRYNEDYECMAEEIHVGQTGTDVNCLTFAHR
jgi:hypothetical protein